MYKKILKIGIPVLLILLLLGINIKQRRDYKIQMRELLSRIDHLTQVISGKDSTLFYYSKMVDNFDITERDLKKSLKNLNRDFADRLKEREERILALHEYNISLEAKLDTLTLKDAEIKDGVLSFEIEDYYPQEKDYFVHYNGYVQVPITGKVNNPVIAREFSFSPIRLNMVMTETARGAWKYNILNAPSWINVGKIDIKSLPPEKLAQKRAVTFLVGGGILKMYEGRSYLTLSAGAEYHNWQANLSGGLGGVELIVLKKLTKN